MNLEISGLFDLSHTLAGEYLARFQYPWQALDGIKDLILTLGPALGEDYEERAPQVWVHKTATVAPTAFLGAPCIIGPDTEVRHCAFIRGSALVGANCVVGHNLLRLHHDLAQKQNARADNLANHTHHADNRVHLRQIAALCI